jgi:AraC-like DNA-binding protein
MPTTRDTLPTIAAGAIRKMWTTLPDLGVDATEVCRHARFDLGCLEGPDARIPLERLYDLWEAVLARLDRNDLALAVAQRYSPGDYGLVGFVCMNCATLGESLEQVTRYFRLWASEPELRLDEEHGLLVHYRQKVADRPGLRLATEATLAEIVNGARLVTQQPIGPVEVAFSHPGPEDTTAHEAFFGTTVRFDQRTTHLRFAPEQLACPLPKADVQLGVFLSNLANQALGEEREEDSLLSRIRKQIAEALQRGVPSIGSVARSVAMSERSLRRRLEESGTTFRALVDDTRALLAKSYLRNPELPLAEVAFLLGFSEPSAFHRAFKRWTQMTPKGYRAFGGR